MAQARSRRDQPPRHGVGSTAAEIIKTYVRLIITEARLLRTEMGKKLGVVGLGLALAAAGVVLLIMALVIVFGAVVIAGIGCLWFGIRQLQFDNLMPKKTIKQVQKDFESIAPEAN